LWGTTDDPMEDFMDQATYDKGREIRAAVLGADYVERATAKADDSFRLARDVFAELEGA